MIYIYFYIYYDILELIFCVCCEVGNEIHFFPIQCFQHHLFKKFSFFISLPMFLCPKPIDHTCVGLFVYSLFCSIDLFFDSYGEVAQSCPTLCNPMGCSLPGSSVHGILQVRILEWVAVPFSRGSFQARDWTQAFCTTGRFLTNWATREVQEYWSG